MKFLRAIARDGWQRQDSLAYLIFFIIAAAVLAAAIHAILSKRDSRSAAGWVGLILLSPIVGTVLYAILGVNRIRRRAFDLRRARRGGQDPTPTKVRPSLQAFHYVPNQLWESNRLAQTVENVTHAPLLEGNAIRVFRSFEETSQNIIEAINQAQRSISLETYIFDGGAFGAKFIGPLQQAVQRKVAVRVLVDAVGARYSWPSAVSALRKAGVPCTVFLPTSVPWHWTYMNLRNHRKVVIVDGVRGFTGGMNLRKSYLSDRSPSDRIQDLHFELKGPVLQQLQEAFAADWSFAAREVLSGETWFPKPQHCGEILARAIPDGPDEDFEKIRWTLLSAISQAKKSIRIITPYFLPDASLVTALSIASLSGTKVEILVPDRNNLRLVDWASLAVIPQLLANGCRIYRTLGGFDHSKLMLVDNDWVLLGSSNWDERSLRLNFELDVECYSSAFAKDMQRVFDEKMQHSREMTFLGLAAQGLPARIRNGICHLLSPYL